MVLFQKVKPKVIAMYNENMGGVDQSDQMRAYYPTGRRSRKLYKYIPVLVPLRCGQWKRVFGQNERRESQKRALTVDSSPENAAHHFISKIDRIKRECVQCKKDGRKTPSGRARDKKQL